LHTLSKSKVVPVLTKLTVAVLLILVMATIPFHHHYAVMAKKNRGLTMSGSSISGSTSDSGDSNNNDPSGLNVIIGTRSYTKGTSGDDTIIGCPGSGDTDSTCNVGDTLRGLGGNDILQGSIENDYLYGDEGDDTLNGADGNDNLYGGPGDDILIGGPGADYFDCGDGQDVVIDFNPAQGDTHADNCEVILNHNSHDIDFMVQHGTDRSNLQALGIGSFKHETSIDELGKKIK
jgi:hypothetical protein